MRFSYLNPPLYHGADANRNLHLGSGILIAVPIPKQHAASGNIIESAIQKALKEAE
jgi:pseudouridine-5'-phosphate glycosidase